MVTLSFSTEESQNRRPDPQSWISHFFRAIITLKA
jgi:hypothetical protein